MWLHLLAILPHYSGNGPRRFVTGATDKNCDQPIDVLVIDGKVTELYSMLPCGGLAYRQARVVRPGEEWLLQGEIVLAPGKHSVVARYCATSDSLKHVDPKLKSASQPPWWIGCMDSAAESLTVKGSP